MMNKRFGMKKGGRKVCFILLIFLLLPNLLQAGEYRAKGWGYLSVGEIGTFLPRGLYGRLIAAGTGFTPLVGLGIGMTIGETTVLKDRLILLPAPIHSYWVPYMDWRDGLLIQGIYTSFSLSPWGAEVVWNDDGDEEEDDIGWGTGDFWKCEIGYVRCAFPPLFYLRIKAGYISFNANWWERPYTSLYVGVTLSFGGWICFPGKKIATARE